MTEPESGPEWMMRRESQEGGDQEEGLPGWQPPEDFSRTGARMNLKRKRTESEARPEVIIPRIRA